VLPSTRSTSSDPPCFHPAGAFNVAVTVMAAGLSPLGYRPTVYQLMTAIVALVDAVAPNAPPPVGTT
jgi:hypothetical protein